MEMCFLAVESYTKKHIPLTYQFLKSYYALFCMYLKVTASRGPNHRCLAQKITQPRATVGWQPEYFVKLLLAVVCIGRQPALWSSFS